MSCLLFIIFLNFYGSRFAFFPSLLYNTAHQHCLNVSHLEQALGFFLSIKKHTYFRHFAGFPFHLVACGVKLNDEIKPELFFSSSVSRSV